VNPKLQVGDGGMVASRPDLNSVELFNDLVLLTAKARFGAGSAERRLPRIPAQQDQRSSLARAMKAQAERCQWISLETLEHVFIGESGFGVDGVASLESQWRVDAIFEQIPADDARTFILPGILEELNDPRPLLRQLRIHLQRATGSRLLLSFHDRVEIYGPTYWGPPANPGHVRSWSTSELCNFLNAAGFVVEAEARVEAHPTARMLCLSSSLVGQRDAFERLGLPSDAIQYLLVTTEHAACKSTGGIGTYCAEMEARWPSDQLGIAFLGKPSDMPTPRPRWLTIAGLGIEEDALTHQALQLAEIAGFLFPNLKAIEIQDYLGVGALVVRARQADLLPPHVRVVIRGHGTLAYLDRCFERFGNRGQLPTAYDEKIALENADQVVPATEFLQDLYRNCGYDIAESRNQVRRLPFSFDRLTSTTIWPLDTVVFFGKRSPMKGFDWFVEALEILANEPDARALRKVVVVGRDDPSGADAETRLNALSWRYEVTRFAGSQPEAIARITAEAGRGVCVLPYRGDNHPLSVLEAIRAFGVTLAARAGGIPELIPEPLRERVLHAPGAAGLATNLLSLIRMDDHSRHQLGVELQQLTARRFQPQSTERLFEEAPKGEARKAVETTVGLIIPCFETSLEQVAELLDAINNQQRKPDDIVVVDDGSCSSYRQALADLLRERLLPPHRLLLAERNQGLSAARNLGLSALATDYVCNIDSDDVPRPDFLRSYVDLLDSNSALDAATSWLEAFYDGERPEDSRCSHLVYRPAGDGWALALTENCLGHANSIFRRTVLLDAGGWDAIDRGMWEDYALFMRLLSCGKRIGVIPRPTCLYRVSRSSMARTHNRYSAKLKLARNIGEVPPFDRVRLLGLLQPEPSLPLESPMASPSNFAGRVRHMMRRLFGTKS